LSDWYENLSKCSTYSSRPDLWWRLPIHHDLETSGRELVAIERGIDFSFNELRYSSISLEIPLAAASGPTQSISICLTWFRRASLETFVCARSFSIFFDNSTVAFQNSSSASPTSQRIIMTLVISSLPIEILVFGLRFLINDKQRQTYNTSAWYPPAPTSNAFKSVLGMLKAWYEAA
jgi:hypothetical protein